jgi:hypothetical protein
MTQIVQEFTIRAQARDKWLYLSAWLSILDSFLETVKAAQQVTALLPCVQWLSLHMRIHLSF